MEALKGPFLPRKASQTLRDRLVSYLTSSAPAVGSPFYSDAQLMEASGLSRKTVRKAMDQLHREGWILRQTGKGSFVGPRTAAPIAPRPSVGKGRQTVRVAVLAYDFEDVAPDWYSRGVLDGLDQTAIEQGISIELMGRQTIDPVVLAQRVDQSRPDVLVVMSSTLRHTYMIAEARRRGIPCLLTGTRMLDLGLPTVCEDGHQGAAMAVRHLAQKGHRRIGLLQRPDAAPWVFARREGYVQGLIDNGLEPDERLVLWLSNETDQANAQRLLAYVKKEQPTALLLGSAKHVRTLGHLLRSGALSVPSDLSIVSFDQFYAEHEMSLGMRPTVVELPLREMGRRLAQMARDISERKQVPMTTFLPCELAEGESVAPCSSNPST